MMETTQIIVAAATIMVCLVALLPLILLWINQKRVHQIAAAADRRIARMPKEIKELNTNVRKPTIYIACFIAAVTILAMVLFYCVHDVVIDKIKPFSIKWSQSDTVNLKSGPVWFYYNQKDSTLNAQHPVSEAEKTQIVNLLGQDDKHYKSYSKAIDELAYDSNTHKDKQLYIWLLWLYAICGLIGVQLRTINNFIGVACYKNEFTFHIWWPWYLARPLQGFLTGAVVFLMIDGKQLVSAEASGGLNTLILAIAFLGGFATEEVYELLRKLSKRIFGGDNKSE